MQPVILMDNNLKKILLVEDDLFISDLYAEEIKRAGYLVKVAHDGLQGLQMLQSEEFDLLLLDIMLPKVNGIELLRTWKDQNKDSKMQVIILTNFSGNDIISDGIALGVAAYLLKSSYTPPQIIDEIKKVLSGKGT